MYLFRRYSELIISKIADDNKIRKYYAIFLNAMATIAKNFSAKVVKNVGDALIFYFPGTSNSDNATAFRDVLECCTAIVAAHEFINIKLEKACPQSAIGLVLIMEKLKSLQL